MEILLALHPSSLQTDLLLHFLLKETHPDVLVHSQDRTLTHLNKRRGLWVFICALLSDKMTLKQAKPFPKKLHSFIPRILNQSWLKASLPKLMKQEMLPWKEMFSEDYSAFYSASFITAVHFLTHFHHLLLNNQMLFAKRHNCLVGFIKQKLHTLQQKNKGKNPFWRTVFLKPKDAHHWLFCFKPHLASPDIAKNQKVLDSRKGGILILSCHQVPVQHHMDSIWAAGCTQEEKHRDCIRGHKFSARITPLINPTQHRTIVDRQICWVLIYYPSREGQSQAPHPETISLGNPFLKGQDWVLDSINLITGG